MYYIKRKGSLLKIHQSPQMAFQTMFSKGDQVKEGKKIFSFIFQGIHNRQHFSIYEKQNFHESCQKLF